VQTNLRNSAVVSKTILANRKSVTNFLDLASSLVQNRGVGQLRSEASGSSLNISTVILCKAGPLDFERDRYDTETLACEG